MDNFKSILGDAAGGALCNLLSSYGASAPYLLAVSLIEPTPIGEVFATTSAMAGLAAYFGCSWDPFAQGPEDNTGLPTGCQKTDGEIHIMRTTLGAPAGSVVTGIREILSRKSTFNQVGPQGPIYDIELETISTTGVIGKANYTIEPQESYDIATVVSGTCIENLPPAPPPDPPTYTYTDPDSGCELNVNFKGWAVNTADNINGVWEISPALPSTRASGGVIGGCNFSPVIYIDDGGGGDGGGGRYFTIPDPIPPDGDEPWWAPLIRGAAQGVAAAATQALIDQILTAKYGGGSYELKGVCELDPDGNPMDVTRSVNFPEATSPDAILFRLDALADMFQFAKDLKQPICKTPVLPPTGEPVTVTFRSDLPSPVSGDPVRKIFTYFDQSGKPQLDHVIHWENFSWQAGPVIVAVNGTQLGKPQVWAASEAEGKRVINHAAQVAGVDMSNAEWLVTSPKSDRVGLSATMRVHVDKYKRIWVTKRDGPDGVPYTYAPT